MPRLLTPAVVFIAATALVTASAGPLVTGTAANRMSEIDLARISELCRQTGKPMPWQIIAQATSLGYTENQDGPLLPIIFAFACLPADKKGARYESGAISRFESGRGHQWDPQQGTDRWITIKAPPKTPADESPWYGNPIIVAAGVRPEDAIEAVDVAYGDTKKDPMSDHKLFPEDRKLLINSIRNSYEHRDRLEIIFGESDEGSWQFAIFRKKHGKWVIDRIGVGTAALSLPSGCSA